MSPKPTDKPVTREGWEAALRERMAQAQAEYFTVSEECKRLMAISKDAQRPDSSLALRQALALKNIQMQNYMAVLVGENNTPAIYEPYVNGLVSSVNLHFLIHAAQGPAGMVKPLSQALGGVDPA